ncbi:hypothetical protein MTO96_022797 [Rhipicephalus appendiculatus]
MASIYLVSTIAFLSGVSVGQEKGAVPGAKGNSSLVCNKPHEIVHTCTQQGEPYERLCPIMRRRWCDYGGQQICLCAPAHFRRLFDDECVPLRDCAKREIVHLMLACFGDQVYMIGASQSVFKSQDTKCVRLLYSSRTETGCARVVMVKERASDYELEQKTHYNGWKFTNYSIKIRAELKDQVPYLVIEQGGSSKLPQEVRPRYPVLHANTRCLITGDYPKHLGGVVNSTSAEIDDLIAGERYVVRVATVSNKVESTDAQDVEQTLYPNSIKHVTHFLDSQNITFEWTAPPGRVDYYIIVYNPLNDQKKQKSQQMDGI